jgi:ATP-dependent helicase/nuclease subunit A
LLKALTTARSASADGELFSDIVDELADLLTGSEQEEMGLEPGTGRMVRIMNLHKAKGLEAPVVFLVDPVPLTDHDPSYHTDRSVDPPLGHFLISVKEGFQSRELGRPLNWDSISQISSSS